jgi:hypothetical protein
VDVGTCQPDEALQAIEGYLIACQQADYKASKWNETRQLLSRWFSVSFPGRVLSTISIKKVAAGLAKAQSKKWDSCFHTGGVFEYCATKIVPAALKRLDHEGKVLAYRNALLFSLSADICARGDDIYGIWMREECIQLHDKKGKPLAFLSRDHLSTSEQLEDNTTRASKSCIKLDALLQAESMTIRMLFTKDKRNNLSSPVTIRRIRRKYVTKGCELKDTFTLMLRYLELTQEVREASCDQALFLGLCAKQAGAKKTVCGGLCGRHHNLVANSINSIRTQILRAAKVDTATDRYTSHAIRGNAECAIVHAANHGATFSDKEGLIRTRHAMETHMKSYSRPCCPLFVTEVEKLRIQGKLIHMTPEEVLRIGVGPHSFK